MAKLSRFFPRAHGKPRVDGKRVLSGVFFFNRNGLSWRDVLKEYGLHKTLYSRWKRWSEKGVFARILAGLAAEHREEKTVRIPSRQHPSDAPAGQRTRPISRHTVQRPVWPRKGGGVAAAYWFRDAPKDKGIRACIPGRIQRKMPVKYDKRRYKRRNRIEIMFGRVKDWRRVATRYDRCPKVFLSTIVLAAAVIYWL